MNSLGDSSLAMQVVNTDERDELLRQVTENSHDCIELLDRQGRLLWINHRGLELREIEDVQSWMGSHWIDCWTGEDHPVAKAALHDAFAGKCAVFTGHSPTMTGTAKWWKVMLSPVRKANGEWDKILCTSSDITERMTAVREVHKLAAFPELNPNPVLAFSADGSLEYFNPAAFAMTQSFGHASMQVLFPPTLRKIVAGCISTGRPSKGVLSVAAQRTLSWSFYPIAGQAVVHCYVGDITERLQLEEQFRQVQKMEAIGQLSGGVAHDFNNLLTAIIGHVGLLRDGLPSTTEAAESIEEISAAANRATKLTRQLLMFSRRQPMQVTALDLNAVVYQVGKMLNRILGEDVKLQLEYAPGELVFEGDDGMIEQVLVNLIVNARDAMPQGGELQLQTKRITLAPRCATVDDDTTKQTIFIELRVADTGVGMSAEVKARIFEPFFTTKEVGKGTGLGLATVYGIVQQHRGWIEVDSTPNQGTTFRIYLPVLKQALPARKSEQPSSPSRGNGEVILLVEDDVAVMDLGIKALSRFGYQVIPAANGVEALKLWSVHKDKIDLLLTDIVMPEGVSGFQLGRQLQDEKPALKVIYTSGYNSKLNVTQEITLIDGKNYITKPYLLDQLFRLLRTSLEAKPKEN